VATNPAGAWKIEQDKKFIYDWTVGFVLHPETPGRPRYDMVDFEGNRLWKCNAEHRHIFPEGEFITEDAGVALRKWRFGEEARKAGSKAVGDAAGEALTTDDEKEPESPPPMPKPLQSRLDRACLRMAELASPSEAAAFQVSTAKLVEDMNAAGFEAQAAAFTAAITAKLIALEQP
jgi:hypothetical protein